MDKKFILEKILEYPKIIIHMHMRPDGDCYGAGFGLKYILEESFPNKAIYIIGETADYLKFVGEVDTITDDVYQGALSIVVDTATKDRVADQRYDKGDYVIKIDHHLPVDDYGDDRYVDISRPATAQIILEFYLENTNILKMNMKAAKALYTGIVTDTGRFKYRSVTAETFRAVAKLLDFGLDFTEVLAVLDIKTENQMKLQGYVLQNFEKTANGVAYIKMTPEIIQKYQVSMEEATSLVNELSCLEDCPVWILFAEYENNIVRARLRSKGPAINLLANRHGGGGHPMACGANVGTWADVDNLLNDADELVKNYRQTLKSL
ncbi:MAG: bifunctional oligoribonuclease/PAP phosphatase NrnA [Candidatus Izemoplasmatales bacterium]|nr:bifunctional oligoribonuclease/PAP phosphatase NrnA [Candidatus Izemoplasmatales bacterium]MDD3865720.1 bifunctional oligoribonuclease/PAP phosphatase NrnA [Candidatus Izemoplasmatales bacterium]